MKDRTDASAYGGLGWSPRKRKLREEIGSIWEQCGANSEWTQLKKVILHYPGPELENISNPDTVQMLERPDAQLLARQHDVIADAYRRSGVSILYMRPEVTPPPNFMFVADLLFMTPEGVILSRPASTVRAGEERLAAVRLAEIGIPILRSIIGTGTFEGADAAWLNESTVLVGLGLRTNRAGAGQVSNILKEMDVDVITAELPSGSMHLMGALRFVDRDLAICRPKSTPNAIVEILKENGYDVLFAPSEGEIASGMALNFVTLGPKRILMAAGNPATEEFYKETGINVQQVDIQEVAKAAGGIGCLTGVLERTLL